jgi:hypothetical protein
MSNIAIINPSQPNDNDSKPDAAATADRQPKTYNPSTVPICHHVKDDGLRCGTPALNGRNFCYHHHRAHNPGARIGTRRYRVPVLDSVASLQVALAHTLQALSTGELSPKQANSMMYGISLGTRLLTLSQPLTGEEQQQVVTEIPAEMEEVLVGPEPENETPEVPEELAKAVAITKLEVKQLKSKLLTPDEFRKYSNRVHDLPQTDPDRYTAIDRICKHDDAYQRLRQMGVL